MVDEGTRPTGDPSGRSATGGAPYTCTFCGCLCDDVELVADAGRIVEARNACAIGRPRLIGLSTVDDAAAPPRIRGREATVDEALAEAARILAGSRAPVIVGLDRSTNETVRKAVALADRIGAAIEVGDAATAWPRIAAMQRRGAVGATLGEVKNRADVVVFWGADPVATHPRHLSRYSVDARGRFLTEGRAERRVVVIDREKTRTAERADLFLEVQPDRELDVLSVLRALVREVPLDPRRVETATGCSFASLQELAELLQGAVYGAWLMGSLAGRGPIERPEARHPAVTGLVRELNRKTKFVVVGLGGPGNAHGAEAALAWQSGFAPGVDFGAGFPESLPGETSAAGRLERGEFDRAVVIGASALDRMTDAARGRLAAVPWLFVGDPGHEGFTQASIALPAGTPGVDESGTFTRVDGVSLPIRAFQSSRARTEGAWLDALREAVENQTTAATPGMEAGS